MKKTLVAVLAVAVFALLAQYSWSQETQEKDAAVKAEKVKEEHAAVEKVLEVKKIEPFTYCALEMKGSYDQHATAFMTLYSEAAKQHLGMGEVPFGVYYSDPDKTPQEQLKWEVGFTVPDSATVQEPLKLKKWDHTLLVSNEYEGSFATGAMDKLYHDIYEWINKQKYVQTGPVMEKYMSMPTRNKAGEMCGKIEIMLPVAKEKEKQEEKKKAEEKEKKE